MPDPGVKRTRGDAVEGEQLLVKELKDDETDSGVPHRYFRDNTKNEKGII